MPADGLIAAHSKRRRRPVPCQRAARHRLRHVMCPKKRARRVVTGNARRDRLPPVPARRFVMEGDGSNQQFSWSGVRLWKAKRIETPRRSAIARTP